MTDIQDIDRAKVRARMLRDALAELGHDVAHGQALDLVARQQGLRDWNALHARLSPRAGLGPLPRGWMRSGNKAEVYEMGREPCAGPDGADCATIRLRAGADPADGFGTLMQKVDAAPWAGQRVALRGLLRAADVSGAATIWLRADGTGPGDTLAFDNLEDRYGGVVTGTTGWVRRRIVLDIPEAARSLAFGFYLRGDGQAWCGPLDLAAASDLPVTGQGPLPAPAPVNMDFSG